MKGDPSRNFLHFSRCECAIVFDFKSKMCELPYGPGWRRHVLPGQKFKAVGGALIGCLPEDQAHASGQLQLIPSYQRRHGQLKYGKQLVNTNNLGPREEPAVTGESWKYLDVVHSQVAARCQD